ncbi:hypothetical protein ABID16_000181 [Rhizobium aquaticum]|uniref:DUF2793 domain-containing protein n=1 Tax=Rhizobium aquaticum TaxID=1549636 RepID=A0ABV2IUS8_9HYPH
MTDTTPNLKLPYILPSQAMKHITHNEALQILDAATNALIVATLTAPPASPVEGALYLVAASGTGAFAGKDGRLAFFIDGAWIFLVPRAGWRALFAADGRTRIFDGTSWVDPLASPVMDRLGVSATPDATNRLAISSEATLFNHAGHSHRMKLNKQASADTASLLFQSNWSGRAEIGLLGNDALQFKASPDGSSWTVGLEIGGDGIVRMPAQPLVSATLASASHTLSAGNLVGFDTMSVMQGGFALGSTLSGGRGKPLIVPAAGLYMIAMRANLQATGAASLAVAVNGTASSLGWSASGATSPVATASVTGILSLGAGDAVALMAGGPLSLQTGPAAYELSLRLL